MKQSKLVLVKYLLSHFVILLMQIYVKALPQEP